VRTALAAAAAAAGLAVYRAAGAAATPLIVSHLKRRQTAGKEDAVRFEERLGNSSMPRPNGPLVWLHGASVGESLSALPIIEALCEAHPEWQVLVTTGTVTSAALMGGRLPARAIHQYVPVDLGTAVRRFLDHWRPDLMLWVESEFWPNLLLETERCQIPRVLVNGRVSARSFARWRRLRPVIERLLRGFDLCLAQSPIHEDRLRAFAAPNLSCPGNLKFAAPPLPVDDAVLARLSQAIGGRPCWVAASTHPGEEEMVGDAHGRLAGGLPGLVSIIVPRHPARGPEIVKSLRDAGHPVALRSAGERFPGTGGIYVADTLGELGLWYRLCGVVFVGGSMVSHGGQNPLEPARIDSALIFGPHMDNFSEIADGLRDCAAAVDCTGADDLADTVRRLVGDESARAAMAASGSLYAASQAEVLDRVMVAIRPYFVGPAATSD
jgi:3-deoxy-D-manno-octulosonic-acid transferase